MEEEADKDYYEILQVSSEASQEAIKSAYKQLALVSSSQQFHPDKNSDPSATARFQDISEAYAEKRAIYDEHGIEGLDEHFDMNDFLHTVDLEDIFDLHGMSFEDFFAPFIFSTVILDGKFGGKRNQGARLFSNIMKDLTGGHSSESGESVDEEEMRAFEQYMREKSHGSGEEWLCGLCDKRTKTEKAMNSHFENKHYEDFLSTREGQD